MREDTDKLNNYALVAEAIGYLREHAGRQPDLEALAAHVGLSRFHLQRVFTRWAGISPKRFLQYLTKEHARQSLLQSRDLLRASLAAGLSGPGRLHDLIVHCEAVTPGELGARGEGLSIRFGFACTPLGMIAAGLTARGVCHLQFVETGMQAAAETALRLEWPMAALIRDDAAVAALAAQLFEPLSAPQPLAVLLKGTNYQIKVWEALLQIPAGMLISYGDLAALTGQPRAHRAAGTAMARNAIAVLIPCHRVIRESGDIGLYRWGETRKRALVVWEAAGRPAGAAPRREPAPVDGARGGGG